MTDDEKIKGFVDHVIKAAHVNALIQIMGTNKARLDELEHHKREAASLLARLFVPFMVP